MIKIAVFNRTFILLKRGINLLYFTNFDNFVIFNSFYDGCSITLSFDMLHAIIFKFLGLVILLSVSSNGKSGFSEVRNFLKQQPDMIEIKTESHTLSQD